MNKLPINYCNGYIKSNILSIYSCKRNKDNTNVLQMVDRGLDEMAYDVNHATALLLLCIEIVATASQLVDTLLYLVNIKI